MQSLKVFDRQDETNKKQVARWKTVAAILAALVGLLAFGITVAIQIALFALSLVAG